MLKGMDANLVFYMSVPLLRDLGFESFKVNDLFSCDINTGKLNKRTISMFV